MTVVEPALNRRAICAQVSEQDTLTLACLCQTSDLSLKWQYLGTALLAVEDLSCPRLSLPPSLCWLTLLPGHCAHSLSVTISSQLYEAHYFNVLPGGDVENSAWAKKTLLSSDDWPSAEISLSIFPFLDLPPSPLCLLSTSVFNFPPSGRKRMNWDDISALGKHHLIGAQPSPALRAGLVAPHSVVRPKLCQLATGCWRL